MVQLKAATSKERSNINILKKLKKYMWKKLACLDDFVLCQRTRVWAWRLVFCRCSLTLTTLFLSSSSISLHSIQFGFDMWILCYEWYFSYVARLRHHLTLEKNDNSNDYYKNVTNHHRRLHSVSRSHNKNVKWRWSLMSVDFIWATTTTKYEQKNVVFRWYLRFIFMIIRLLLAWMDDLSTNVLFSLFLTVVSK